MIIYNAKIDGDQYRISKFNDGELESSYLCTEAECDCPAGVRPSCRHRQMLPQMIAADIVNTSFFWDFDLGRAVDFSGTLKSNIDAMNELAVDQHGFEVPEGDGNEEQDEPEAVGEAQHSEPNPTSTSSPAPKPFVRRL